MTRSGVLTEGASSRRPVFMLHAGLDLSRRKLDVCLLSAGGELVEEFASPPDADGLEFPRFGGQGLVRSWQPWLVQ